MLVTCSLPLFVRDVAAVSVSPSLMHWYNDHPIPCCYASQTEMRRQPSHDEEGKHEEDR